MTPLTKKECCEKCFSVNAGINTCVDTCLCHTPQKKQCGLHPNSTKCGKENPNCGFFGVAPQEKGGVCSKCGLYRRHASNCSQEKGDSLDSLVRDLTKVGSISKSEARRRIQVLLTATEECVRKETICTRWHSEINDPNGLVDPLKEAYQRGIAEMREEIAKITSYMMQNGELGISREKALHCLDQGGKYVE